MFKFSLKQKVKDSLTGFEGMITARVDYLHEESQYYVESKENSKWIVEERLEVVE